MPNSNGFRGGAGIKAVKDNFNPALGFIYRKDIRDITAELGYTYRPVSQIKPIDKGNALLARSFLRSVYSGATLQ